MAAPADTVSSEFLQLVLVGVLVLISIYIGQILFRYVDRIRN